MNVAGAPVQVHGTGAAATDPEVRLERNVVGSWVWGFFPTIADRNRDELCPALRVWQLGIECV